MINRVRRRFARPESPWKSILANGIPTPAASAGGRRILCASSVGGHPLVRNVDSLIAMGLWLRGAEPELLLCDGQLTACEACEHHHFGSGERFANEGPQPRLCGPCFGQGEAFYEPLPTPVRRYSDFLEPEDPGEALARASTLDLDECFRFELEGLKLGEQARAGVLRFFGKAQLHDEPSDVVLRVAQRYAAGAMISARVARLVIDRFDPEVIVAHHGVYVPQGVLGEVARHSGVRVVNWGVSYRNTTIIASHDDTYHRTMMSEPHELWDRPLAVEEESELMDYLETRRRGQGDWTWVTPESALRPEVQQSEILVNELGLDPELPIIGLLTNVLWDAQLYYEANAFADMLEWLWTTIDYFTEHPGLQLIVRIHPHEVKIGNRQPVATEIAGRYPLLPSNIKVIPHDHPYNTYALMSLCRAVLIYGTKTGVELTPYGTPVVVSGDAWIRGKGLTTDVSSRSDYLATLDTLHAMEPLPRETIERARRYAYHYFHRRMIPLRSLDPDAPTPRLRITSAEEVAPGNDPGLDVMCEGILNGTPFVYDRLSEATPEN